MLLLVCVFVFFSLFLLSKKKPKKEKTPPFLTLDGDESTKMTSEDTPCSAARTVLTNSAE